MNINREEVKKMAIESLESCDNFVLITFKENEETGNAYDVDGLKPSQLFPAIISLMCHIAGRCEDAANHYQNLLAISEDVRRMVFSQLARLEENLSGYV